MSDVESIIKERMQDFIESAHKYNGDPEIVREWCENFLTVNGKQFQKRAFSRIQDPGNRADPGNRTTESTFLILLALSSIYGFLDEKFQCFFGLLEKTN